MTAIRRVIDPNLPYPLTLTCVKGVGFQITLRVDRALTPEEGVLVRALLAERVGHCGVFCGPAWEHGCDDQCGQSEIQALTTVGTPGTPDGN